MLSNLASYSEGLSQLKVDLVGWTELEGGQRPFTNYSTEFYTTNFVQLQKLQFNIVTINNNAVVIIIKHCHHWYN